MYIRVQFTVPSTSDVDREVTQADLEQRESEIIGAFSDLFGGATSIDAVGGWKSGSTIVRERVKQVYSWAESVDVEALRTMASEYAKKWSQEAIMLEVGNEIYFEGAR
jgi:hypothetical protein